MLSFHVDPDLNILFENLTAQISAQLGLGTLLLFETPADLQVDIFKVQWLTSG